MLVRMDGMAVFTGSDGIFVLSGVAPGVHYIDIDRSSIPSNLIPAVQLPLRVDVLAGTEVELVIDLTQSGSIAGTVTRLGPEEEIVLLPGGHEKVIGERVGIYGVIIELRGELETLRSKTGPQGEFRFTALRPGTWVISIPQFGDDVERIVVTLEPGEEAIVNIVIPPKLREATLLENIEIPVQ
ncbi:MAG TPA: carboxypeptidase regulatory-like domain-containing protein [Firmicutes bacterium]|nr:carboxypeptidase regulatory-like domain-containing protein [Bacillota bacterium]